MHGRGAAQTITNLRGVAVSPRRSEAKEKKVRRLRSVLGRTDDDRLTRSTNTHQERARYRREWKWRSTAKKDCTNANNTRCLACTEVVDDVRSTLHGLLAASAKRRRRKHSLKWKSCASALRSAVRWGLNGAAKNVCL